jgi:hypothetical protein
MGTAIVRRATANGRIVFQIELVARDTGLHPELVRRLWRLGLVDETEDSAAHLARALRLRRDLGLNYAGAVLAVELLARIEDLEARLRRYEQPR